MQELYIRTPFSSGEQPGESGFAAWYQETNINRPIVECRLCHQRVPSVLAQGHSRIPCTFHHKNRKGKWCNLSGWPGVVIRKSVLRIPPANHAMAA